MATICVELCKTGQIAKAELQPVDYKFLPFIACTERQDVQNYNKQHQNDKPSKSFIQGGNETCGEFLKDEDYGKNREYSIYELITNSADNKKIELEITLQSGSRRCYYDETMYISTKVTGETAKNKIKKVTIDKEGNPLKYNEKLKLTIETTLKEGESLSFYVDFYARKKTTDENPLHCGRMKFIIKGKCFCNRDFTVQEVENIVSELRKREYILDDKGKEQRTTIINEKGEKESVIYSLYTDKLEPKEEERVKNKIFYLKDAEYLRDADYKTFTKELNTCFRKYKINTCLRKIHFLAQCYQETVNFRITYEKKPQNIVGDNFYRGRGLKQISHDYNYLEYYGFYKQKTEYFNNYLEHNASNKTTIESVNDFNTRTKNAYIPISIMEEVNELAKKISTEMYHACNAAGWYWDKNKINNSADKNDIFEVSKKVNNPTAKNESSIVGFQKRKFYRDILLKIFNYYENCISYKK